LQPSIDGFHAKPTQMSGLHLAAYFGSWEIIRQLSAEHEIDLNFIAGIVARVFSRKSAGIAHVSVFA
jgi:hypothetical protein